MRNLHRFRSALMLVLFAAASLAAFSQSAGAPARPGLSSRKKATPLSSSTVTTSGGTVGTFPEFHSTVDIENSPIIDSGGVIGLAEPMTALSVNGILYPAACGALTPPPGWCSGSDIGAWINAAISALPTGAVSGPNYGNNGYKIGTVELPNANGMTWSTPVRIGPGTNLIGQGKFSIFTCTASNGRATVSNIVETSGSVVTLTVNPASAIFAAGQDVYLSGLSVGTWLNSQTVVVSSVTSTTVTFNDPTGHGTQVSVAETGNATPSVACLTIDHSASSGQFAHTVFSNSKIGNFTIEGNGAAGQSIIKFKDVQGIEVHSVVTDGATDAGQACYWLEDINSWTERNTFIDDSSGYNCNIGWRFTSEASISPHPSFGYNRFLDIKFNTAGAQTAFSIENNSYLYSGTYRITGNKGGAGSIVWFMKGGAQFYENELQLQGEENGTGGELLDITSPSNQFTYWGNIVWGGGTPNNVAAGATVIHWLDSNYFVEAGNFSQNPITWASAATLASGFNLNSVTACGNYEVTSPVNGPSVSPSNALLHLQVICAGAAGPGYIEQIAYQANYTSRIPLVFQRNEDGGTWGSWFTLFNGASGATGHATCWKSAGQVGYCSSAVNSSGICTCN